MVTSVISAGPDPDLGSRDMGLPACPDPTHAGSHVVKAGTYGHPQRKRQRFRCFPTNGDEPHRFTPLLTRPLLPEDASCVECASHLEPWQGQPGARDYRYDARAIARTLVRISEGASYREASMEARRRRKGPLAPWERNGHLASSWVDVFAPVVAGPSLPARWPEVVVLDSKKFVTSILAPPRPKPKAEPAAKGKAKKTTGKDTKGRKGKKPPKPVQPTWHVLVAAGADPPAEVMPWAMLASEDLNTAAWVRFFRSMPGEPRLVVCDRGKELLAGVEAAWPNARITLCEHHFFQNHRKLINGLSWHHPVRSSLFTKAFRTVEDWDAFSDAAKFEHQRWLDETLTGGTNLTNLMSTLRHFGEQYRDQIEHRKPGDPRSNGAAEAMCRKLGHAIPRLRANRMTNLFRTNNLVLLLLAHQRGDDDELVWAARIREYLKQNGGRAPIHQHANVDKGDNWSLCYRPKRKKPLERSKAKRKRNGSSRKRTWRRRPR